MAILSLPTTPRANRCTVTLRANTQQFAQSLGRAMMMKRLEGARWAIVAELPPMKRADAAAWCAFLTRCNGRTGRFYCGDLAAAVTAVSAIGTVTTIPSRTEDPYWGLRTLIYSVGWTAAGTVLSTGAYVSYDTPSGRRELRKLTANAVSSTGQAYDAGNYSDGGYGYQEAYLYVAPSASVQLPAGTAINYTTPLAVMRLVDDEQAAWDIDTAMIYGIRFSAEEVWDVVRILGGAPMASQVATVSAAGISFSTGTGAFSAQAAVLGGECGVDIWGTGALLAESTSKPVLVASGLSASTGTGAASAPSATLTAQGTVA